MDTEEGSVFLDTLPKQSVRVFINSGGTISIQTLEFDMDHFRINESIVALENCNLMTLMIVAKALILANE